MVQSGKNEKKTMRTMSTWCPGHSRQTIKSKSTGHHNSKRKWNLEFVHFSRETSFCRDARHRSSQRCPSITHVSDVIYVACSKIGFLSMDIDIISEAQPRSTLGLLTPCMFSVRSEVISAPWIYRLTIFREDQTKFDISVIFCIRTSTGFPV